jgi:hypothetical protein
MGSMLVAESRLTKSTSKFLPLLSFSNKLIVSHLDKGIAEFTSRGENAFARRLKGSLLRLTSSIQRSA